MIEIVENFPINNRRYSSVYEDLQEFIKSSGDACKPDISMFISVESAQSSYSHAIKTMKLPVKTARRRGVLYLINTNGEQQ